MIRLLFISLLLFTNVVANEINTFNFDDTNLSYQTNELNVSDEYNVSDEANQTLTNYYPQKVLYLNYKEVPSRVVKGQIFSITIKTLSTIQNITDINYKLTNHEGVKPLDELPYRENDDKYFYDTFYFSVTSSKVRLPDFTATLIKDNEILYKPETLLGKKINVITLNPKQNFSNIIANKFELVEYKTTSFDRNRNILIFVAVAENCDISALRINSIKKQGIESISESYYDSKVTYYVIINKDIENFSFTYFNLLTNKFSLLNIPIILDDDSVTTQSDLKPKDQSHERLKMSIAAIIALIFLLFIIWTGKYIYIIAIIIPVIYIAYLAIPSKNICIKQGTKIHLLPVKNGTIFETTNRRLHLQKEGEIDKFMKIRLRNNKIGWVRNEDICSY